LLTCSGISTFNIAHGGVHPHYQQRVRLSKSYSYNFQGLGKLLFDQASRVFEKTGCTKAKCKINSKDTGAVTFLKGL
jgi:hypothetical protein